MTEHFTGLVQIIEAMDTFNLSHDGCLGLLRGKCYLVKVAVVYAWGHVVLILTLLAPANALISLS